MTTYVCSRGGDVEQVTLVVNFEKPNKTLTRLIVKLMCTESKERVALETWRGSEFCLLQDREVLIQKKITKTMKN